jgi:hypothetical protein
VKRKGSQGGIPNLGWPLLVLCFLLSFVAWAGDEDKKQESIAKPAPPPEAAPLPQEAEAPPFELPQEQEEIPEFSESVAPQPPRKKVEAVRRKKDRDLNIAYSELLNLVEPAEGLQGVLPPALGTRGYRPSLIALGVGDRTPGLGVMLEYSWNRIGMGAFYSYRNLRDDDVRRYSQSFGGLFATYRWLPWMIAPYFLLGLEVGSKTDETFGGMAGVGIETRIYYGWTILFGYTYHSVVQKGFLGGAIGWMF